MAFIGKLFISPDTFEKNAGVCALVFADIAECGLNATSASVMNASACADVINALNGTVSTALRRPPAIALPAVAQCMDLCVI